MKYRTGQWLKVGDYEVFVEDDVQQVLVANRMSKQKLPPQKFLPDGMVTETGQENLERVIYINVVYRNRTAKKVMSCRRNQWVLYDDNGYSYDPESADRYYDPQQFRYLGGDRAISPDTKLRGWLAFVVPFDAVLERVQFLDGFLGMKSAAIFFKPDDWK